MKRKSLLACWLLALAVGLAPAANAQELRGRIIGTIADSSGAVLPGVTVTATSPALIQPQVVVSGEDGTYRLIALPPGMYVLTFELAGFKTLIREGIRTVVNQTLTVNVQLEVAALEETVTVSGESPVVDTSTTRVGTNFTKELLTDIPNARDIWAAISQAPGMQVTGFDVGGSHTGTQTGYMAYGFSGQSRVVIEGINVTEGTSGSGGYYDFGSLEEFQIGTSGNMTEQNTPGVQLNMVLKSGGDQFSSTVFAAWQGDKTISDNVPDTFKAANQRDADGFFTTRALSRGNPIDRQWEFNPDVGGPILRKKAWFYASYRIEEQYKFILGSDQLAQSELDARSVKGTLQLTRNNQLTGFYLWRAKNQPLRNFSPSTPVSAAWFQQSTGKYVKAEWTSVISSRLFLNLLGGIWIQHFPLRPTSEGGFFPADQLVPGRLELSTGQRFDGGATDNYQIRHRPKPQASGSLNYFKEGWKGSHDFKIGFETFRDRDGLFRDQPFNIFYRDRNGVPVEVDIYNTPVEAISITRMTGIHGQDTWKLSRRLTLNLGLRVDHYSDGWPDQTHSPEGVAALKGDPRFTDFFAERTMSAKTVAKTTNAMPRLGFAYDLKGDGKSVVKGFFGRFYFNSTATLAPQENPVGRAQLRYQFTDLNGNRLVDGPAELGRLLRTLGGAGFVRIDPNIERPYGDEISAHFEHEVAEGLSARVSYIHKNARNEWEDVDLQRVNAYTIPVTITDPGPDGRTGTSDDSSLNLVDRPAGVGQDRVFTNPEGYDSDYHTVEVTLNRRFRNRWLLLGTIQKTWLKEFYGATSATSATSSAGNSKTYDWRPNARLFGRETTSFWNYKLIGRYVLPWSIGLAGSLKVQSGRQWGRALNVGLAGAGTETIRVEPVDSNRAPTVTIADFRVDKTFTFPGRAGKLTAMLDVFNFPNAGTVTAFRTLTAANFKEVTALLDPRIIRLGVRYEF